MLLSVALLGGFRFGIRAASDLARGPSHAGASDRHATLLYGAGHAGVLLVRSAKRDLGAGVRPVGFLDDDPNLAGGIVAGLRVFGGLASLPRAAAETGAKTLLITMPGAPGSAVRRVVDAALALHLEVRTVPSMADLLDGSVDAYRVRRVRVEDLLRRPMVTDHAAGVEEIIRDSTVLITGGGGSIGSELARQVFALGPRRLVLVDRAESPLYLVQRELEARRNHQKGSGELRIHLANVASRAPMERLVAAEAPNVIFHAAAYKHVPMMEEHPSDAAYVNIGGTLVMLDAAAAAGVDRFVFVSTDKAVRPSSVMGASKRIAEMLVADAAQRTGRPYVSVRFGNVLGSTGSVVPIFQQQLEDGEPLTITHPDMTRFFMTIPEAAWLILDAAALGQNGDLFVLDMGEPVRIMDLARDLVRLAGRDPESQPIETVGLRPGEKLHEALFYDAEQVEPTASTKVLRALAPPPPPGIREDVRRMLALASGADDAALREALLGYVRGVEEAPPISERAGATRPGNLAAIDVAQLELGGATGAAMR
jgi:FlaA1/EpsC-like NDP-sugar epimerase